MYSCDSSQRWPVGGCQSAQHGKLRSLISLAWNASHSYQVNDTCESALLSAKKNSKTSTNLQQCLGFQYRRVQTFQNVSILWTSHIYYVRQTEVKWRQLAEKEGQLTCVIASCHSHTDEEHKIVIQQTTVRLRIGVTSVCLQSVHRLIICVQLCRPGPRCTGVNTISFSS